MPSLQRVAFILLWAAATIDGTAMLPEDATKRGELRHGTASFTP